MLHNGFRLIQGFYQACLFADCFIIFLPQIHIFFFQLRREERKEPGCSSFLRQIFFPGIRTQRGGDVAFPDFPDIMKQCHFYHFQAVQPGIFLQDDHSQKGKPPGMLCRAFLFSFAGPGGTEYIFKLLCFIYKL